MDEIEETLSKVCAEAGQCLVWSVEASLLQYVRQNRWPGRQKEALKNQLTSSLLLL